MDYDAKLWKRVLFYNHPDRGGDEEVFKFLLNLRDEQRDAAQRKAEILKNMPSHPFMSRATGSNFTWHAANRSR